MDANRGEPLDEVDAVLLELNPTWTAMTADALEAIRQSVAGAKPMTEAQRRKLSRLFR